MFYIILVSALVGSSLGYNQEYNPGPSNEKCVQSIYRDCNYPQYFSDEELENVRQFLNYSFTVLADVKPDKPLCPKLHVRQDWKCLTDYQKTRLLNVWKQMYERKDTQRLANIHAKYWPTWHKTSEVVPSHRWLTTEFERIMQTIDPGVTLPYWNPYTYGTQPERASIWDTFGHSGNYSNGYDVPDGFYAQLDLIPTIKRHWSAHGAIHPWYTQEFLTYSIQNSKSYSEFTRNAIGVHFPPHLNIGGYEGQYSTRTAPNEVLFYLHHTSDADVDNFRWQLQRKEFLTPLSYNNEKAIDQNYGTIKEADIFTDTLTGVPWVTIREVFWVGFGDYCYIPDQLVRPINNLWKGLRDPMPTAIKRLPNWILEKYFPAFLSGNYSGISHTLEEVGQCNTRCLPLPKPSFMRDTAQGVRQFEAFRFDEGIDLTENIEKTEQQLYELWSDLNRSGYCSPYVTHY